MVSDDNSLNDDRNLAFQQLIFKGVCSEIYEMIYTGIHQQSNYVLVVRFFFKKKGGVGLRQDLI